MKKPRFTKSIMRNIHLSLLAYTALTVALLWLFQIVFLNTYYEFMQKNTVIRAGRDIAQHIDDTDLTAYLESICYKTNMSAIILSEQGVQLLSSDMLGSKNFFGNTKKVDELFTAVGPVVAGEQEELVQTMQGFGRDEMVIYAGSVTTQQGGRRVILLNAQLQPIASTKSILKSQMGVITVVLVLLSLGISQFLSRQLVKPVRSITKKAQRLADGDYSADYTGDGFDELEELASTLNFSANGLSRVEELRRELVANVSHDLKTPLTMIRAYAEMIRDLTGDNKQKRDEQLGVIIDETDRLSALVNDLIRVSRDEMHEREMILEPLDVRRMAEEVISRFSQTCADYDLRCECREECRILADRAATEQVLYNLISNAINYTGEDKRVTVSILSGKTGLRVEVCDTGRGIPQEQLPLIWERYYRSSNTHQRPVAGSGLGLSIVHGALEKQGFPYGVESVVGEGSCFWFEAPRAPQQEDQELKQLSAPQQNITECNIKEK